MLSIEYDTASRCLICRPSSLGQLHVQFNNNEHFKLIVHFSMSDEHSRKMMTSISMFYLFCSLNSRFGTIAVPNVMIFHSAKAIARFNGSERTLASLTSFVSNVTGE